MHLSTSKCLVKNQASKFWVLVIHNEIKSKWTSGKESVVLCIIFGLVLSPITEKYGSLNIYHTYYNLISWAVQIFNKQNVNYEKHCWYETWINSKIASHYSWCSFKRFERHTLMSHKNLAKSICVQCFTKCT